MTTARNKIQFSVADEQGISPRLDRAIRETLVACFPADREYYQRRSWWHCIPSYRVLGRDSHGSIVAHTAIVERVVSVGPPLIAGGGKARGSEVRVAGIQSFCVLPGLRGTGLSDKMMSAAMEEAYRRDFDAGLLFCLDTLAAVYVRMGWRKLDVAVYMAEQKSGKTLIPAKNVTMFYPLRTKQFPPGDIDLSDSDW